MMIISLYASTFCSKHFFCLPKLKTQQANSSTSNFVRVKFLKIKINNYISYDIQRWILKISNSTKY